MLFLISYKFTDANAQDKGAKMLKEWYDKGGPQNRPEGYDVKSWIFLPQNGNGYSVVDADSLETIWKQWLFIVDETHFNRIKKRAVTALLKNQYYPIIESKSLSALTVVG